MALACMRGLEQLLAAEGAKVLIGSGGAERCEIERGVPGVEHRRPGVLGHVLAVAPRGPPCRLAAIGGVEPVGPAGGDKARNQALDVPLPRRDRRFIEVVDVEDELALGCGEAAEIQQMAVAARLYIDPGNGS